MRFAGAKLIFYRFLEQNIRFLLPIIIVSLAKFIGGILVARIPGSSYWSDRWGVNGWWLVFTAINLHLTGLRFTLTRLSDAGFGTWHRRALVLLVPLAVIAITFALLPAGQRVGWPQLEEWKNLEWSRRLCAKVLKGPARMFWNDTT